MDLCIKSLVNLSLEALKKLITDKNWTVYSAFILANEDLQFKKVVALSSGIKCIPESIVQHHPDQLVHDCHAEVICRRAFNCFLLEQLKQCKISNVLKNEYIEFDSVRNRWSLRPSLKLIFYTSCSPCKLKSFCYETKLFRWRCDY